MGCCCFGVMMSFMSARDFRCKTGWFWIASL